LDFPAKFLIWWYLPTSYYIELKVLNSFCLSNSLSSHVSELSFTTFSNLTIED
jgi:hypothetical protein